MFKFGFDTAVVCGVALRQMPCGVQGGGGGGGFARNCDEDGVLLQEQLINTSPLSDKRLVCRGLTGDMPPFSLWGVTMEEEGEELDEGFNSAHFCLAAPQLSIIP